MRSFVKFLIVTFLNFITIFAVKGQDKYVPEPKWYKTYDIKFYSINLDISDSTTFIRGNTFVNLDLKESTDTIVFNFNSEITIDSVFVNFSKRSRYIFRNDLFVIGLERNYTKGSSFEVNVYYHGNVSTNSFFSSLSNERDNTWNIPVTWSLSEPFGARNWFPCKQQLTDKADSCWVFLTVPHNRKAGSVGILTDTIKIGNKIQYQWKTKYPIAYYLISFSLADYKDYSFYVKFPGKTDSLLVQNYIYNREGFFENNKSDIDRTAVFLELYSKLFGLYPFYKEKYGHCIAPIGGGMEHQTMTTLINFSYSLVSHELAHQWFGDHTTCSSWQDIWINEGFASYCEYLAYEFLDSKTEAKYWMNGAQNSALKEPDGSVFIPSTDAKNEYRIFSSNLSYKKGAVILHMLRKQIDNDSLFFRSMRAYLSKYRYTNASGENFKKVMEEETGLDFTNFFNQWYYGSGFPQFDISWKASHDTLSMNVKEISSSKNTPFFNTPFDLRISGIGFDTIVRLTQIASSQNYTLVLPNIVNNIEFDPENWLLKKMMNINRLPELPSEDDYFTINPNPFNEDVNILFKTESAKDEKVQIVNLNGGIVSETYVRRKKEFLLNTSSLQAGIYLLVVTHGQNKYIRKIIKANIY